MSASYELFQHTADLGVRVRADTLGELIWQAACGLAATIGTLKPLPHEVPKPETFVFLGDSDRAGLLRDFLGELLFRFSTSSTMAQEIHLEEFSNTRLSLKVQFVAVDKNSSEFLREVKAVTFHGLKLEETESEFLFECIVDI